jgi:hypothetical protein
MMVVRARIVSPAAEKILSAPCSAHQCCSSGTPKKVWSRRMFDSPAIVSAMMTW